MASIIVPKRSPPSDTPQIGETKLDSLKLPHRVLLEGQEGRMPSTLHLKQRIQYKSYYSLLLFRTNEVNTNKRK